MAIVVKLEALMLQHGISLDKIAAATGITNVNVSRLKTGKVVAYRGTTIDALIKRRSERSASKDATWQTCSASCRTMRSRASARGSTSACRRTSIT